MDFFGAGSAYLTSALAGPVALSTTAWTPLSVTYTAPAGTTRIHFGIENAASSGVWYLDDIAITGGGGGGPVTTPTVVTAPAGWTQVTDGQSAAGRLTTFWRLAAAGDPVSWSFGLSQSTKAVGGIVGYSGADTTAPIDAFATGVSGSGGSHVAPSVTTTGVDRTVLSLVAVEAAAALAEPATTLERVDIAGGAVVPTVSLGVFDVGQAVAGATGARTATSAVAPSATATIALRPAGAPPPPPPPPAAAPAFRSITDGSSGAGGTTVTVNRPAATATGDVLVAAVSALSTAGGGGVTTAYGEGFETSLGLWHPWWGGSTVSQGAVARTGLKSLQVNPVGGLGRAQASVPVVSGQQTATLYANGAGAVRIQMDFFGAGSAYLSSALAGPTPLAGGGGWTAVAVTYTPPAGTTRVHFGIENSVSAAPWYVDDVTITTGGGGGPAATAITAPAGWAALTDITSNGARLMTFWRTASAADPATWTFGLSASVKAVGVIASYSGTGAAPIDASESGTNAAGALHAAPSVTTTGVNRTLVTIVSLVASGAMVPPAGANERADVTGALGSPSVSIEIADRTIAAAGATGTSTATSTVTGASNTATIALRP